MALVLTEWDTSGMIDLLSTWTNKFDDVYHKLSTKSLPLCNSEVGTHIGTTKPLTGSSCLQNAEHCIVLLAIHGTDREHIQQSQRT